MSTSGYNLVSGSNMNTSGFAGMVTNVMTDNPNANQVASTLDMITNLVAGGLAVHSANGILQASIQPGTYAGYLTEYNLGSTAYAQLLQNGVTTYNPGTVTNTLTAAGALSSTVNSLNNIIGSGGILAE